MQIPEIQYARADDGLNIAYQRFGSGPDLVWVPGLVSNVEISWDSELFRRAMLHTADHVTMLHFDKRGIGCSDRWDDEPTLEMRIRDILAVMDAAGIERAHVGGVSEGGLMAAQFAIRHPERVDRLMLANALPGLDRMGEFDPADFANSLTALSELVDNWGRDGNPMVDWFVTSQSGNADFVAFAARFQRQSGGKSDIVRQIDNMMRLATPDYAEIQTPTLVVACSGDPLVPAYLTQRTAELIPGATFLEIDNEDHFYFAGSGWRDVIDPGLEFLLERPLVSQGRSQFATVLFTDIVGSTAQSRAAGDDRWRDAIDGHNRTAQQIIEATGGTYVKSTGDGLLAHFPLPSAAANAAVRLQNAMLALGLPIRAGLHAGEIQVHDDGDVSGLAVNFAARVEQCANDGTVWVSSSVRELLRGTEHTIESRGTHALKGIDGDWELFEIER